MAGESKYNERLLNYVLSYLERTDMVRLIAELRVSDEPLMFKMSTYRQATELPATTDLFIYNYLATGEFNKDLLSPPAYIVDDFSMHIWPAEDARQTYLIDKAGIQLGHSLPSLSIRISPGANYNDVFNYIKNNKKAIDTVIKHANKDRPLTKRTPLKNAARDSWIYYASQKPKAMAAQEIADKLSGEFKNITAEDVQKIIRKEKKRHGKVNTHLHFLNKS